MVRAELDSKGESNNKTGNADVLIPSKLQAGKLFEWIAQKATVPFHLLTTLGLNPYRKSIKDIIRNPKGVLQAISNKMAIVDNELESLVLDDWP